MRLLSGLVALLLVVAGCATPATSNRPSASVAPASESPGAASSPSAASSPGASALTSLPPVTQVNGDLLARISIYPDVPGFASYPDLSLYADGTLLQSSGTGGFTVTRLTSAGISTVLAEFRAIVGSGGQVGAVPSDWAAGFTTFVVSVRVDGKLVAARTTNASVGSGVSKIVAFGERWRSPSTSLPAEAWASSSPLPYVAAHWHLALGIEESAYVNPGSAAGVIALIGDPSTFGIADRTSEYSRCAVVDPAMHARLLSALKATGVDAGSGIEATQAVLSLTSTTALRLGLTPMLPDQAPTCPVALAE